MLEINAKIESYINLLDDNLISEMQARQDLVIANENGDFIQAGIISIALGLHLI